MGGGAKVAVDEDAQVTDNIDWFKGRTSDRDAAARKLRLPMSQCKQHHLSFIGVRLELIRAHPAGYFLNEERNVGW